MDLSCLGILKEDVQIYRYFLTHRGTGPDSVSTALGLDRDTVDVAINRLSRRKLLRLGNGQIAVTDPAIGMERLIEQRLTALNNTYQQLAAARETIKALSEEFANGQAHSRSADIERIEGLDDVRARLDDLAFFTYHEVLGLQPGGPFLPEMIEAARPLDFRCLRRGVTMRTVVSKEAVADTRTAEYLRELVGLGAETRVISRRTERMIIYDRSRVVVPIDPDDSSRGALIVRQPSLVANMIDLFDKVWAEACDIVPARAVEGDEPTLTGPEKEILRLLAEVGKDEIGAREMGISVRTFRRYVADLMVRLGATNRFQAALLAKEKGWV